MWVPGRARLAPERAALRRAAGTRQGRDDREVRRRSRSRSGAAATTSRRRRSRPTIRGTRASTRATAASTPRACPRPSRSRTRWRASSRGGASGSCPRSPPARDVLVVAHGNSLRALVKMLDGMSDADIVEFNIPTGVPILYELDGEAASAAPRGASSAMRPRSKPPRAQSPPRPETEREARHRRASFLRRDLDLEARERRLERDLAGQPRSARPVALELLQDFLLVALHRRQACRARARRRRRGRSRRNTCRRRSRRRRTRARAASP